MPRRVPHPTAQAIVPIPGSPVSTEAAVWSATATTRVTVTSRRLMGHTATTVSAAVYGRPGSHKAQGGIGRAREGWRVQGQHQGKLELSLAS